jgi:hypothetical protein
MPRTRSNAAPKSALERLAFAAVRECGPAARLWVDETRRRYPAATPDALARLAAWELARAGRRQAIGTGAVRLAGPVVVTGTLARTQAELVLTIAAAYGLDPADPERARDLIVLLQAPVLAGPKTTAAVRTARIVAGVAARLAAARLVVLGGATVAALQSTRATADVAERARSYFRFLQALDVTLEQGVADERADIEQRVSDNQRHDPLEA